METAILNHPTHYTLRLLTWSLLPCLLVAAGPRPTSRVLSAFHDDQDHCLWTVLTAGFASAQLAALPHRCPGAQLAVARSGKEALVHFANPSAGGAAATGYPKPAFADQAGPPGKAELWRLPLAKGAVPSALPPLPAGVLERAGFDGDGHIIALTLVELNDVKVAKAVNDAGDPVERFGVAGVIYEVPAGSDGTKAVAYAYRLTATGTWEKIEDKPTSTQWDYALGVDVLDAAKAWQRPDDAANGWETLEVDPRRDAALLAAVKTAAPAGGNDGNDGWVRRKSRRVSHGELLVWQISGEFAHDTGLILFKAPGGQGFTQLPELGYTAGDLTTLSFSGDLLLVTTAGLRAHPRVYDMRTGKRVYASDNEVSVGFWSGEMM